MIGNRKYLIAVCIAVVFVLLLFGLMIIMTGRHSNDETAASSTQPQTRSTQPQTQTSSTAADAPAKEYHVCIETGHGIDSSGKWDTGCSWNGEQEAELMIPITQAMTDYLKARGVDVYTDAYSGNDRNLDVTLDYLDTHEVDAFVNVHCDYEGADGGTMPLYNTEEQKRLAQCLNEGVHEAVDIPDRGLQMRSDLQTLCSEKVHCTSCLFETGSISQDHEVLTTQAKEIGEGLAKGLLKYLNEKKDLAEPTKENQE